MKLAPIPAGTRIITVARVGARMARIRSWLSAPIWCSAEYTAVARQSDGVVTWRRTASFDDATSGFQISRPMLSRASAHAAREGIEFMPGVRHGQLALREAT